MQNLEDKEGKEEVDDLSLVSIIGFEGGAPHGLISHPDKKHVIYPMGTQVVIQNWETKQQTFLGSHPYNVSALAITTSGKYIATGLTTHMGFKAPVSIWDVEQKKCFQKHEIHKIKVVAVAFSSDERLVYSVGGRDDANVVVWDIKNNEALCGSPATGRLGGEVTALCPPINLPGFFLTGGADNLRVWNVIPETRNLKFKDVAIGMIKRHVLCIKIDDDNKFMYCGTSTGDVMKVCLNFPSNATGNESIKSPVLLDCMALVPFSKTKGAETVDCYHNGVRAIALLPSYKLIIGAGDGQVDMVIQLNIKHEKPQSVTIRNPTKPLLKRVKCAKVKAEVSSLVVLDKQIIVGTMASEIYAIDMETFLISLITTCHTSRVYGLAFPHDYSKVFATCAKNEIRVWNIETSQELLRICVENFTCTCVLFSHDGKSIVSSWDDGTIRAFTPQTGKPKYVTHNAHTKGVSALDMTSDGAKIVSGGCEGQVRIWKVMPTAQTLCGALQEHRGPVSSIHIKQNNKEAVSGCTDGTCIIWDLERLIRNQIIFANTLFLCVRYYPNGCQILTTGTDRKISYWETYDGSLIRELEGSAAASVNSIGITKDGKYFVTASNDLLVKVWKYNEGTVTHVGIGHAGVVITACISPDNKSLVSVSSDGAVFIWKFPHEVTEEMELKITEEVLDEPIESDNSKPKKEKGKKGKGSTSKQVAKRTTKRSPKK